MKKFRHSHAQQSSCPLRVSRFTPDTTKQSSLCRVWRGGVNWTVAINVFTPHVFCLELSRRFTAKTAITYGQLLCVALFSYRPILLPSFPVAQFSVAHFFGCRFFRCPFFPLPLFLTLIFCCPFFLPSYFSLPNFTVAQFSGSPIFR